MDIKNFFKSKKFKNFIVTLIEIIVIAAIIMGILMTVQSKLKNNSSGSGSLGLFEEKEKEAEQVTQQEEDIDEYHIVVNKKKSVLIVYQYNKDKSSKKAIKVMRASIGKQVKVAKYKLKESYSWRNASEGTWNKYVYRFSDDGWIQSAEYSDKYSWTLKEKSYNNIGKAQNDDANIMLCAGDAKWLFDNCVAKTVINVIKGSKADKLPFEAEPVMDLYNTCGWDPTDTEKGNPYKSVKNGTVSANTKTVYVEKGDEVDYLSNIIAINKTGKNITKKLQYDTFNTASVGTNKINYSFTAKDGTKYEATIKYKVIDTIPPVVRISKDKFEYEMDSIALDKIQKKSVKEEIEALVKKSCSASEGTIQVTALPKEELVPGINYVRVVATDEAGNVGSAQAIVEIKEKEKEKELSGTFKSNRKNKKEEETTKKKSKKEQTTKKKNKNNK